MGEDGVTGKCVINNQSSVISHQFEKAILSEKGLKHACLKDAVLDFDINDKLYKSQFLLTEQDRLRFA